ncbi:MAG: ROK family protein [Verrucomicrobiales bacterium]
MRSPEDLRHNLGQAILHVRSRRATSRRTLADVMSLSPTTAGIYVDQLIGCGYLREAGLEQGRMGRPKRSLNTRSGAGWFAGVEFNAERVQAVRVDFSGALGASEVRPLPEGADSSRVMAEITNLVTAMRRGSSGPLLGIGLGAPGVVDPQRGVGVDYAFMPDWKDVPVADRLGRRFKVPVTVENNLRTIALAERWFGGAQQLADYLILGPRSGFGVTIVHGGSIVGGVHHAAGEVGYWPWPDPGSGTRLHDRLSAPAVWRRLKGVTARARLPVDLGGALAAFADSEGPAWQELVRDYAHVLANLQLLLDPSHCFLHGPLTALGQRFCGAVVAEMPRLAPAVRDRPLALLPSDLGDDAGALGAASLAMETWVPEGSSR